MKSMKKMKNGILMVLMMCFLAIGTNVEAKEPGSITLSTDGKSGVLTLENGEDVNLYNIREEHVDVDYFQTWCDLTFDGERFTLYDMQIENDRLTSASLPVGDEPNYSINESINPASYFLELRGYKKIRELVDNYVNPDDKRYVTDGLDSGIITDTEKAELKKVADEAVKGCNTDYEKIMALTDLVIDRIIYGTGYTRPYEVWEKRSADCAGHTNLLQAFLNLEGIPCITPDSRNHTYNMAYDSQQERWIYIDATNGIIDFDAKRQARSTILQMEGIRFEHSGFEFVLRCDERKGNPIMDWDNWYKDMDSWYLALYDITEEAMTQKEVSFTENALSGIPVKRFHESLHVNACNSSVESITLPSSMEYVGGFNGCNTLKSVRFGTGSKLKGIDEYAFAYCSALETFETDTTSLEEIGNQAFRNCSSLKNIGGINSPSLSKIGEYAFYVAGFENLDLSKTSLTEIPTYALASMANLKSLKLPDSIKTLGKRSINGNSLLEEINIPSALETMGEGVFCRCRKLKDLDFRGTRLQTVGIGCFEDTTSLQTVAFPSTLKTFGKTNCFKNNTTDVKELIIESPLTPAAMGYNSDNTGAYQGRKVGFGLIGKSWFVSFDGNGATSGTMTDAFYNGKEGLVLPECTYTKTGKVFIGWSETSTASETIHPAGTILDNPPKTLFALWGCAAHKWNSGTVTTEATCVDDGVKTITCTLCQATKTEVIQAKGHGTTEVRNAKEATCTETGYTGDTYCKVCETLIEAGIKINAKGHGTTEIRNAKAATCKEAGYTGDECCKVCNAVIKSGSIIPKTTNHTWNNGVITKEATCVATGVKTYTCTVCDTTKTEVIPAKGHGATEIRNAKEATCTEAGHTGNTYCKVCDAMTEQGKVIPAKGHGATEIRNAKAATCKEAGYTGDEYCKVCNTVVKQGTVIAKTTNHTWNNGVITKEATCVATGVKTYTCTVCKTTKTEVIDAKGHGATEIRNAKAATCKEAGYTGDAYCKVCNALTKQGTSIPKTTNHVWDNVVRNAKEATCKEAGYTGDIYCKVCNTVVKSGSIIPKTTNHTWNDGVVTREATCVGTGVKTYTCTVCQATKTEAIAAKGHQNEIRNAKEATCIEKGYTGDTYCKVCGILLSVGTVTEKSTVHAEGPAEMIKEATCTETGMNKYVCTLCKEERTEEIQAVGHKYVTSVKKATTSADGKITSKCSVCNYIGSETVISRPAKVTLSTTTYTYDGKTKTPSVKVYDAKGKILSTSSYSVSYSSGRKSIGTYTVKVTFKGNYSGTISKTFTIVSKSTSISKISSARKAFAAYWKKVRSVTGYQLQYSTKSNFSGAKTVTVKDVKKTVKSLPSGKKYYVRVRAYKTVSKKNYYSSWSKTVSVKTK